VYTMRSPIATRPYIKPVEIPIRIAWNRRDSIGDLYLPRLRLNS
jgi:hypothetical protein